MPFPLSRTHRDVIQSGSFLVPGQREKFRRGLESDRAAGLRVIDESAPLQFLARAFRGVLDGQSILLHSPDHPAPSPEMSNSGADPEEAPPLILIPTGGTTGSPRLVRHTWETLVSAAEGLYAYLGYKPLNSIGVLPLWHVGGLMQAVRAIVSGGQLCLWDWKRLEAGDWPPATGGEALLSLVPTQLTRMLDRGVRFPPLGAIILGGSGAGSATLQRFQETGLPIRLSYGMTETAAMVTLQEAGAFPGGQCAAGPPLPHVRLRADGNPGAPALIEVEAESLFLGYEGEPPRERGAAFLTSDLGYVQAGVLHVTGRSDRIIITGGEKVDPARVEAALLRLEGVRAAAVTGLPDEAWGQRVAALVQGERPLEAIREALKNLLPAYQVPKEMKQVEALPLTPLGKVDYAGVKRILMKKSGADKFHP